MRRFSRRFDKAAEEVTRAGLEEFSGFDAVAADGSRPSSGPVSVGTDGGDRLLDGMMNMLIAQRMFMASVRAARVADQMLGEAVELGEESSG